LTSSAQKSRKFWHLSPLASLVFLPDGLGFYILYLYHIFKKMVLAEGRWPQSHPQNKRTFSPDRTERTSAASGNCHAKSWRARLIIGDCTRLRWERRRTKRRISTMGKRSHLHKSAGRFKVIPAINRQRQSIGIIIFVRKS